MWKNDHTGKIVTDGRYKDLSPRHKTHYRKFTDEEQADFTARSDNKSVSEEIMDDSIGIGLGAVIGEMLSSGSGPDTSGADSGDSGGSADFGGFGGGDGGGGGAGGDF